VTAVGAAEDAIVELQQHRYQALVTDFNLTHKNAACCSNMRKIASS
jgi:hypothetical protein